MNSVINEKYLIQYVVGKFIVKLKCCPNLADRQMKIETYYCKEILVYASMNLQCMYIFFLSSKYLGIYFLAD